LVAHPSYLFLILLLPERQIALFSLLEHLNGGWPLQEVLHLALVVLVPLVIVPFVIELN